MTKARVRISVCVCVCACLLGYVCYRVVFLLIWSWLRSGVGGKYGMWTHLLQRCLVD